MPTRKHPDWIDWRKAAARKIILDDLESGRLSLLAEEISAEEAWLTRHKDLPVFVGPPRVVFSQFKERLAGHRKQVTKKKEQEENGSFGTARAPKNPDWIDWKNSEAKDIIPFDLIENVLPLEEEEMSAEDAWELICSHLPEFVGPRVVFSQFKERLADHRKQVTKARRQSHIEHEAFLHDTDLCPLPTHHLGRRNQPIFDRHPAKRLLRQDIENKKHVGMFPSAFQQTRPECGQFDAKTFEGHICQEIRRVKCVFCLDTKREAKPQKQRERIPETQTMDTSAQPN